MTPAIIALLIVAVACWIGGIVVYWYEIKRNGQGHSFGKLFQLNDRQIPWSLPVFIGLPLSMLLSTMLIVILLPVIIIDQLRKPH
ncbi:MAG TPA: hypothetical protein VMJ32_06270 [Pirellulales bacterium]|nr:hypothetical protein [Pirellulales bacterium]